MKISKKKLEMLLEQAYSLGWDHGNSRKYEYVGHRLRITELFRILVV